MAVSKVGSATGSTNNLTITLTPHASTQVGDLLLAIVFTTRSNTDAETGFQTLIDEPVDVGSGNFLVAYRFATGGDSWSTTSGGGTGGNAAGMITWRGAGVPIFGSFYNPASIGTGPIPGIGAVLGSGAVVVVGAREGGTDVNFGVVSGDGLTWSEDYDLYGSPNSGTGFAQLFVDSALVTNPTTLTDKTASSSIGFGVMIYIPPLSFALPRHPSISPARSPLLRRHHRDGYRRSRSGIYLPEDSHGHRLAA